LVTLDGKLLLFSAYYERREPNAGCDSATARATIMLACPVTAFPHVRWDQWGGSGWSPLADVIPGSLKGPKLGNYTTTLAGMTISVDSSGTWRWNGLGEPTLVTPPTPNTFPLLQLTPSSAMVVTDAAMAPLGSEVWAFTPSGDRRDTLAWKWGGTSWDLVTLDGPSPPGRDAASLAPLGDTLVLFGGAAPGKWLNDTWTWDGVHWTDVSYQGGAPPPRAHGLMASIDGTLLLFGGQASGVALSDTWTWDGKRWTPHSVAGPPGCDDALIAAIP
jgi:hypothetical protein